MFAINESFNAATVKREREDVPEYQRLPTCLKLIFKEKAKEDYQRWKRELFEYEQKGYYTKADGSKSSD